MAHQLLNQFSDLLQDAAGTEATALPPQAFRWETPKDPSLGDLSCSVAFKLASVKRQPPPAVAEQLADTLRVSCQRAQLDGRLERIEAKSGFVNLFLSQDELTQVVRDILRLGSRYGTSRIGAGQRVLLEFVSANPTGPLSVAHGRQAAVGDVLTRLMRSQGYRARAEYYLNDEGRQIELLGRSLRARYAELVGVQEPFPEDGYYGAYVTTSAGRIRKQHGEGVLEKPLEWFMETGMKEQLAEIQRDLKRFGLAFDHWTSQRWLRTSGKIDAALRRLKAKGVLYDAENATWFASTKFGDDKDRVVRKRDGEMTYLAPDIAYHQWKFQQGYEQLINLWGPDHHGYIARLKASVQALGLSADQLVIRIIQLVTLSRKGKPVPMSKRQGEFVTFREIMDEVGVDATRFFYLMRTMDSHLDFDLELATSKAQENPVYYVQYAHARICSILTHATRQLPWWNRLGRVEFSVLTEPEERLLMRQLFQFPLLLASCVRALEPHGLTVYLQKLAEVFHVFYTKHRVLSEDHRRSQARLRLVRATRIVLANGLFLLGVSAPHRMEKSEGLRGLQRA